MTDDLSLIAEYSDQDRDLFRKSLHRLLSESFIIRAVKDDAACYSFIVRNRSAVEAYLECAGWILRVDEPLGVISWKGPGSARINLTKDETIILVIARLIYEEKKSEITLLDTPAAPVSEFLEKHQSLTGAQVKKTRFYEVLRRLQALKLIRAEKTSMSPDTMISLFPSIAFALDSVAVQDLYSKITRDAASSADRGENEADEENEEEVLDADSTE